MIFIIFNIVALIILIGQPDFNPKWNKFNYFFCKKMNAVKQFEALFDAATIAGVVTDTHSAISNFNKKAESNFGYRGEQ